MCSFVRFLMNKPILTDYWLVKKKMFIFLYVCNYRFWMTKVYDVDSEHPTTNQQLVSNLSFAQCQWNSTTDGTKFRYLGDSSFFCFYPLTNILGSGFKTHINWLEIYFLNKCSGAKKLLLEKWQFYFIWAGAANQVRG